MDVSFMATDLKKADPDRYLLSLFSPMASRPALWALFLFNHEIVRTRSVVSDTRLGLIRLQWWRDEIAKIYAGGDGGQIPILSTMAPVIHAQAVPQELFETLIYAREFDLEDVAPASVEGLRHYADFTTTPLNKIALRIVGEEATDAEIQAVSSNFGLIEVVRSVPLMLAEGRCYLPEDLLVKKNLTPKKIMDFNHKAEIIDVIKTLIKGIEPCRKPDSRFLKISQTMMHSYLNKLSKNDFDVFSAESQIPPSFLALRLWLSSLL